MQDQDPTLGAEVKADVELVENSADRTATVQDAAQDAAGIDTLPSLAEQLRAAELKAAEHHDAWLRAKAETENVRRRAQEDIIKAGKFAADKFAQSMLPVKDSLEAALATENATLETLREGVELTLKQLVSAFTSANITEVNPVGEKFDPNKHQAISALEADGEPNTVITVLQKGYLLNERTMRPALVVVSKAKTTA
jgi:molecular chaperone GrpE